MFTTLHLFPIWCILKRLSNEGTLYIILTRLLEDREHRLNQNLSKYIAVAEESYPFLIRDKRNIYVFRQSAEDKGRFVYNVHLSHHRGAKS